MLIAYPIFYAMIVIGAGCVLAAGVLAAERYLQRRALRLAVERRIAELNRANAERMSAVLRKAYRPEDVIEASNRAAVLTGLLAATDPEHCVKWAVHTETP